jgi:uncharacterized protein (DUF1015 family)
VLAPLRCLVVTQAAAGEVISPAYDALTPQQRAEVAAGRPRSWLNVTASPMQPHQRGDDPRLLASNRRALVYLLQAGLFTETGPALFLYRLTAPDHVQTAVVGHLPVNAARDGRLLGHESSQPDRVSTMVANLREVGVTSSPVAATWRGGPGIQGLLDRLTAGPPLVDVTVPGDVRQQVWAVSTRADMADLSGSMSAPLYIVDGHHRTAAAVAYRDDHPSRSPFDDHLLIAAFHASELRVAPFHRLVRPDGHRGAQMSALHGLEGPVPDGTPAPRRVSVVDDEGRWWRLPLSDGEELDATLLHRAVLEPLLGVGSADPRLAYVPGHLGLQELARRAVDEGGVGFALSPPELSTVLDRADAGRTMPPKTTFFHPKVRSGVFVRLHDPADAALVA